MILEYDRDNNYLHESKGMSFGVRGYFITNEAGDGVMIAEEVSEDNLTK